MHMWLQILIRSISLFILAAAAYRILGKGSIDRLPQYKLISAIAIGVIAALISTGIIVNLAYGIISLIVWILLPVGTDYLSMKSKGFHDLINGKETVLIKHGKIMEENLKQTRLTGEELLCALRSKNAFNLADVEFAVMETTGEINIFTKSDKKPVSARDLGIKTAPRAESQTIILDGNVLNEPLASLGLNREWLRIQLENMGVSLDNVFLGQVDSSGDLYLDLFDDAIELPQPKVKEMVYANIEKAHASLEGFAMETMDQDAKEMYGRNAERLKELMVKLKPYLLR